MKTTIEISDHILAKAKQLAADQHDTLRNLAEAGLRKVIKERSSPKTPSVKPVTFRGKGLSAEFQGASWRQFREAAYEGHG